MITYIKGIAIVIVVVISRPGKVLHYCEPRRLGFAGDPKAVARLDADPPQGKKKNNQNKNDF